MLAKESSLSVSSSKTKENTENNETFDMNNEEEQCEGRFGKPKLELLSWPNPKIGPNINLHFFKKRFSNQEEKNFFFDKIKKKKKTELCKNWEIYHDCYYKDECCFAHGIEELRQNISVPSYKTKECKAFLETKFCPFGSRCNYRHIFT